MVDITAVTSLKDNSSTVHGISADKKREQQVRLVTFCLDLMIQKILWSGSKLGGMLKGLERGEVVERGKITHFDSTKLATWEI